MTIIEINILTRYSAQARLIRVKATVMIWRKPEVMTRFIRGTGKAGTVRTVERHLILIQIQHFNTAFSTLLTNILTAHENYPSLTLTFSTWLITHRSCAVHKYDLQNTNMHYNNNIILQ